MGDLVQSIIYFHLLLSKTRIRMLFKLFSPSICCLVMIQMLVIAVHSGKPTWTCDACTAKTKCKKTEARAQGWWIKELGRRKSTWMIYCPNHKEQAKRALKRQTGGRRRLSATAQRLLRAEYQMAVTSSLR